MKCPNEHGDLKTTTVGTVEIDICETCGGGWYDPGELRVLKDRESLGDYRWIDVDLWKDPERFHTPDQRGLVCTRCDTEMVTLRYGETNVVLDACSTCKGVWLDKNEYDEIIAELEKRVNTTTLKGYLSDLKDEFIEIFVGREGPISGLKDLDRVLYLMQLRFGAEQPGLTAVINSVARR
jgi:Zn-finger nucleic acid-binding protein